MYENSNTCACASSKIPEETLSMIAASVIQTLTSIGNKVEDIKAKLCGSATCPTGEQSPINCMEDALRLARTLADAVEKDLIRINERL